MSHPLYNPYASGNQSSTQGQYRFSGLQAEGEHNRTSSHSVPGMSFSSSGVSSMSSDISAGMLRNYRPEQSRTSMDENIEISIDRQVSRDRQELSSLGKPMHQSTDSGTCFTSSQRDEFCSTHTGMSSYSVPSTSSSLTHRHLDIQSGSSSFDWMKYQRPTADDTQFYSSSTFGNYASTCERVFNAASDRDPDMQVIPGLGDYDDPKPDKPAPSTDFSGPRYTSESAAEILQSFGLEKDDLELLLSYPEDELTPTKLPFILRQIRSKKAKRITNTGMPKPYPGPQSSRTMMGIESQSLTVSGGSGKHEEEVSSAIQPSKVIEYGHTGKYTGGVGNEIRKNSESRSNSSGSGTLLLMDNCDISRPSREPLQKSLTEMRGSSLGSPRGNSSSVSSLSSLYTSVLNSVIPPHHDQPKRLQTKTTHASQPTSLPKKDTDIRYLKSDTSQPVSPSDPVAVHQSASKPQPPGTLVRSVHPSRPGLVLIGSKDNRDAKEQTETQGRWSTFPEQMKMQQKQQPIHSVLQQSNQLKRQQTQKKPASQREQVVWSPGLPSKPVPSSPLTPNVKEASQRLGPPIFIPCGPRPIVISPTLPPPIPALMNLRDFMPSNNKLSSETASSSKVVPTLAMMQDYAAASPRIFPHTCCLCIKECTYMEDWLSHQNTSPHLENCRVLRKNYPEWDGEIILGPRIVGKETRHSNSTSSKTPKLCQQKTRYGSRSRSRSHSRSSSADGRRTKHNAQSQSPHCSRYARRTRSRSQSPQYKHPSSARYRSRSRSRERQLSPRWRDHREYSPKWNEERLSSPRRSRDKRLSPRRSHESRSSPRSDERHIPPRSNERRLPPKRSDERCLPQRRSDDRRLLPKKNDEKRSSTQGSSSQRKKPNSLETLAKKLLETSAVQSLSKQPDLETVVKTLAPALLAEIANMTSSSSSTAKKGLMQKLCKANPTMLKREAGKTSPPTMIRLEGIQSYLSRDDVVAAVEQYGKTKSVVLFRSKLQAIVCFEKEEDARKLKSAMNFEVKGVPITVIKKKETVSKEKKKPSQSKSATSSVSTPQTIKPTTSTLTRKVLPTPKGRLLGHLPSGGKKTLSGNLTTQKIIAKAPVKDAATVSKSKVLVSKAKNISTKQNAKLTVQPGMLPVTKVVVKKNMSSSTPTIPKSQPNTGQSTQTPVPKTPETRVKESAIVVKEKAMVDKSANKAVPEPAKGKDIVTEAKVLANRFSKPKTTVDTFGGVEKVTAEKALSLPSKSAALRNHPDNENSTSEEEAKIKIPEVVVMQKVKAEVVQTAKVAEAVTKVKIQDITEEVKAVPSKSTVSQDHPDVDNPKSKEEAEQKIPEDVFMSKEKAEVGKTANVTGAVTKVKPEGTLEMAKSVTSMSSASLNHPDVENHESREEAETKIQDTEVTLEDKAEVVETSSEPRHQAKPHKVNDSQNAEPLQFWEAGVKTTEPMEVGSPGGEKGCIKDSQDKPTVTTQTDPSVKDEAGTTELTATEKQSAASMPSSSVVTSSTDDPTSKNWEGISWSKLTVCYSPTLCGPAKNVLQLLMTGLPPYGDGCYTEQDLIKLLLPFGFRHVKESIYGIPQTGMAIIRMPTVESVQNVMKAVMGKNVMTFQGCKISFQVLGCDTPMSPIGIYTFLMRLLKTPSDGDGSRIIFIDNISPSEINTLRLTVTKTGFVQSFLPLLNKVFIEFKSPRDADHLGVWYSLLRQAPKHHVHRLSRPKSEATCLSPSHPENALPEVNIAVAGATVPSTKFGVPQGSMAPFWVPMKTFPYLFPTASFWFIIPDYLTVTGEHDIEDAGRKSSKLPTIMLTGLPEGAYRHEDVVQLVSRYFSRQDLQSLYYNVMVFTLQRRAFVFFSDWPSCCNFVRDHIKNPVSVKGCRLSVHFVQDHMCPESSEEMMYRSAMKWSNAGLPQPESLEERLLFVEISETYVALIRVVMKAVASIAPFVNFLPLANRICIEMADSSAVTQVLDKYHIISPDMIKCNILWSHVRHFETLKGLKRRLKDDRGKPANAISVEDNPPAVETQTQPPHTPSELSDIGSEHTLQTSGSVASTMCDVIIVERSATGSSNVVKEEDGVKPRTETPMEINVDPEANEDVEKVKAEEGKTADVSSSSSAASSGDVVPASFSPAPTATVCTPEEKSSRPGFPKIDENVFKAITEAVRQCRLKRESKSQSAPTVGLDAYDQSSTTVLAQNRGERMDFTDDNFSDILLFEEPQLNTDDFVTVDECCDETIGSEHHRSLTRRSGKSKRSGVSHGRQTSLTSSTDSKRPASSSKLTKASSSDTPKNSSEPTKPLTTPSPSPIVNMPSCSTLSTKTPSSSGQKNQNIKAESPGIASPSPSPTSETASSSSQKTPNSKSSGRASSSSSSQSSESPSFSGQKTQKSKSPSEASSSSPYCETPSPPGQKTQKSKAKSPGKASNTEYSGCRTRSSSAVSERAKIMTSTIKTQSEPLKESSKRDLKSSAPTESSTETISEIYPHTYKVLDSIEEENAIDEPSIRTRSSKGKRESTNKKDSLQKNDTPTVRRSTPARKTRGQNKEKSLKDEEEAHPKCRTPSRRSVALLREVPVDDATYEILDSVEDDDAEDELAKNRESRRRPPTVKATKKESVIVEKDDKGADEEEVTYQILDSVGDETVNDQPTTGEFESSGKEDIPKNNDDQMKISTSVTGSTKTEEEEEPMYQIIDSVEDEELMATELPDGGDRDKTIESPTKEESSAEGDAPVSGTTGVEAEGVFDSRVSETCIKKEDESTTKTQSGHVTLDEVNKEQSPEKKDQSSSLVNLDNVSDEEEDYPDDTREERTLRKKQSSIKEKQSSKIQEVRRTRHREERTRERGSRSSRGGSERDGTRRVKKRMDVDTEDMVTLDEVGADEAGEGQQEDGVIIEGDQTLVTLDEFVEEEEEKAEERTLEACPLSHEDESVHSLNPETFVTLDEARGDDEEKQGEEPTERTLRSSKRKHDETEESMIFVTLDEVEMEEEEEEEKKEAITIRTRGRPKKRSRQTAVRKSTRGKKVSIKEEREEQKEPADAPPPSSLEASPSSGKVLSTLSCDVQQEIQETEAEAASQADMEAASAAQDLQPEQKTLDPCEEKEGRARGGIKELSKGRRDPVEPEEKRSRSLSPGFSGDVKPPSAEPTTSGTGETPTVKNLQAPGEHEGTEKQSIVAPPAGSEEKKAPRKKDAEPINQLEIMEDSVGIAPDHGWDASEACAANRDSNDPNSPSHPKGQRIQFYDRAGRMMLDKELADPNNWGKIASVRPGHVPTHIPFSHMDIWKSTEVKSQSKLVSCFAVESAAKKEGHYDVRVTLYGHHQGPWAEIERMEKETTQFAAFLVAPPRPVFKRPPQGYFFNEGPKIERVTRSAKRGKKGKRRR